MSFSANVNPTTKMAIQTLWGANEVTELAKDLGLSQLVGKGKCKTFLDLRQRV